MKMIKPEKLNKGDTVGIIAPASPPNESKLNKALSFLEELEVNVKLGTSIRQRFGYLAGDDESRLKDLHTMFRDPSIKAIICACGGYGTGRIAGKIDYSLLKKHPKIFWGYSDITFLHTAIHQQTGLVTFHGPMLSSDIGKEDVHDLTKESFKQLFQLDQLKYDETISPLTVLAAGSAEGQLIGGNLALLTSTLGTKYEVDTKNKLLFFEDIDEEPYRVDRMLNQLHMAGKLEEAAGILVCDFNGCEPKKREESLTLEEVINDYVIRVNRPAIMGFKIGHSKPNFAIPVGAKAKMETRNKEVVIESGVK